jgi:replicative DNA helicase
MSLTKLISINELSNKIIQCIESKGLSKNIIPSRFKYLDKESRGLSLGELVFIAFRPAMCKILFVVNLVSKICKQVSIRGNDNSMFFKFNNQYKMIFKLA